MLPSDTLRLAFHALRAHKLRTALTLLGLVIGVTSLILVMTLIHGAQVYDVQGQNVCLTDSLTIDAKSDDLRQLIFFPDGHLRYDWQYAGAILL